MGYPKDYSQALPPPTTPKTTGNPRVLLSPVALWLLADMQRDEARWSKQALGAWPGSSSRQNQRVAKAAGELQRHHLVEEQFVGQFRYSYRLTHSGREFKVRRVKHAPCLLAYKERPKR